MPPADLHAQMIRYFYFQKEKFLLIRFFEISFFFFSYLNLQVKRKPGREVVTFLLVCNLAMWAINTLETNRADSHPIQVRI